VCSLDLWLIKRGSGCFEGGGDSRVVTIASPSFRANFGCDTAGSDSSVQLSPSSPALSQMLSNFGLRCGSGQIVLDFRAMLCYMFACFFLFFSLKLCSMLISKPLLCVELYLTGLCSILVWLVQLIIGVYSDLAQ